MLSDFQDFFLLLWSLSVKVIIDFLGFLVWSTYRSENVSVSASGWMEVCLPSVFQCHHFHSVQDLKGLSGNE